MRVPSPKGVPYEQVPELNLAQVTRVVLQGLQEQKDLVIANFANGDVIGHTANRAAKIECARLVSRRLGEVAAAARACDYVTFITADHGNLEEMLHLDGTPHVAHTSNPVPFVAIDPRREPGPVLRAGGSLADVAPTVLAALGLPQPAAMTGTSLAPGYDWQAPRRVLLVILDGWGLGEDGPANPICLAETPAWDELLRAYPWTRLAASGPAVGLQPGKPGNSEAGHLNLGAGRIVLQDDVRLDQAMSDGSFESNEVLCRTIGEVKARGRALHLVGLLSEKSSHGSIEYPLALLRMAAAAGLEQVYLHVIFDGRSTAPGSAPGLLEALDRRMAAIGAGQVVSGMGRFFALDRDGNYARTEQAYNALVLGCGRKYQLGS